MAIAAIAEWRRRQAVAQKSNDQTQISQGLPLTLAGQDTFYAGVGQVPTHVLQPARPALRQSAAQRFHTSSGVNFIGQDVMYGAPGQAGDYTLPRAFDRLRPPTTNRTYAWDNINVIGQDVIYGSAGQAPSYDLPKGLARPRQAAGANTWTAHTVELIGSDRMYAGPGQVARYDLPASRPAPRQAPANRTWVTYLTPYIPTCTAVAVVDAADDASWYSGGSFDSIGLEFGHDGAQTVSAFFRFNNVVLPQGALITSGSLTLFDLSGFGPSPTLRIRAIAEDNATAPTTAADANGRTLTTASRAWLGTSWTGSGNANTTPDLSAIIQEVISRPGWVIGNSIVIYVMDDGSGVNSFGNPYAYESESAPHAKAAQFNACYGTPTSMYGAPGQVPNYQLPRAHAKLLAPSNRTYVWTDVRFIGQDTIYGAPGQAATYQTPNAAPRRQAPAARTWINLGEPFLAGSDTIYAGPGQVPRYDLPKAWPQPRPAVTQRTWVWSTQPILAPIDNVMYGEPGQVPSYQLPRAHSRRAWQDNRTWVYNQTLALPVIGIFTDYVWELVLPSYNQMLVLPAYLDELPLAVYNQLIITPVYSSDSELPIYYSVRRL